MDPPIKSKPSHFLTSTSPEFHPCDVIEDADGSLLVIDTGGWFAGAGCPTSKISKPQYYGAIYRIRRKDAAAGQDPRGVEIDWSRTTTDQIVSLLADQRPLVRDRAVETLAARFSQDPTLASVILKPANDSSIRRRVIWALSRCTDPEALTSIRSALTDSAAGVRLAALHSITMSRDAKAVSAVTPLLDDPDLRVRRQAAAVLGRLGDAKAVRPLLAALADPLDRTLEHALIYALIEIDDRASTLTGLADQSSQVRRAALMALDQMDHGRIGA